MRKAAGRKDKGHEAELRTFVKSCRTGRWPIPWEQLFTVTWASIAAVESLRDGFPHRVDEILA